MTVEPTPLLWALFTLAVDGSDELLRVTVPFFARDGATLDEELDWLESSELFAFRVSVFDAGLAPGSWTVVSRQVIAAAEAYRIRPDDRKLRGFSLEVGN